MKASQERAGFKRPVYEMTQGEDFHRKSGMWNYLVRVFDRINNRYKEIITQADTDKIIKFTDEPLTDHKGHDSDKKDPNSESKMKP